MDPVFLSRIQFGLTAGFHYIFPPLTLGMTLVILLFEGSYLRNNHDGYRRISSFLVKLLGLVFVMGVATGIVLEFSFGTNWPRYSRMVGDIFGAPLAAEAIFAFFLESVFLGVLVFGRERVSKRTYFIAALLVFFASHLSGLWIIIANSWMQTPAGFVLEDGRAKLVDFFAAAFNDSTWIRFTHTIMGGWITGSLFIAGISSWYLLKGRDQDDAKPMLSASLWIFIAVSLAQFISGHIHAVQVARTQPVKMAAFEALWKTQRGAPMSIIGIPDPDAGITHLEVAIPKLLSFAIHFDPNAEVKGLDAFHKEDHPPIVPTYLTYHAMIGLGSLFALIALIGIALSIRRQLFHSRWYLWILLLSVPLPFIANEVGWISAEIGRQPWAVYGILRTADAGTVSVPAGQILFSIIMFSAIFMIILAMFIFLLIKIIRKGPASEISYGYGG